MLFLSAQLWRVYALLYSSVFDEVPADVMSWLPTALFFSEGSVPGDRMTEHHSLETIPDDMLASVLQYVPTDLTFASFFL